MATGSLVHSRYWKKKSKRACWLSLFLPNSCHSPGSFSCVLFSVSFKIPNYENCQACDPLIFSPLHSVCFTHLSFYEVKQSLTLVLLISALPNQEDRNQAGWRKNRSHIELDLKPSILSLCCIFFFFLPWILVGGTGIIWENLDLLRHCFSPSGS